jgi:hypothetical protein
MDSNPRDIKHPGEMVSGAFSRAHGERETARDTVSSVSRYEQRDSKPGHLKARKLVTLFENPFAVKEETITPIRRWRGIRIVGARRRLALTSSLEPRRSQSLTDSRC